MQETKIREGVADVPGARLRYRLAGTPGAPLLVFENGWGASYEMWTWIERELAPHAQLLFYNRAGIGGSELRAPQTVAGLSAQFAALPAVLGLQGPVIAVGQSYGGLMCSLHAAQIPAVLESVIEIDPTPERAHPHVDAGLRQIHRIVAVLKLCLRLGLPNVVFGPAMKKSLPAAEAATLLRVSLGNGASLDAAREELGLLDDIRAAIAAARPGDFQRLLIGAGTVSEPDGVLGRLLVNSGLARKTFETNQALQRERTQQDPGCRYMSLPYDHGGLVFGHDGARATAAAVLAYLRGPRA
ncbi:alpha/beta fold hydrolase [Solimonas terrae]|uniref:Alpha/beta hydrolase n=1 Tax=Solimonas terrae TaxID=1396819 RepID=A0A6M2BNA5_9GAMM|nr:alpha/beta hydrolase [Solimonas terrae]NGY04086.1 alpha/beta hydrolase [Solimonas terrae]